MKAASQEFWLGAAGHGRARRGSALPGVAATRAPGGKQEQLLLGKAWQGLERRGEAGRGSARLTREPRADNSGTI